MSTLLLILVLIIALAGILGSFLPVIPGPPISFVAILLFNLFGLGEVSSSLLWTFAAIASILTILDFYLPGVLVKYGKGSRLASRGAGIGAIAGLFIGPWGIIIGPLIGAYIGEVIHGTQANKAIRIALFAFLGFLTGVVLKFIFAVYVLVEIIIGLF